MNIIISLGVLRKLRNKHNVTLKEVYACFRNRTAGFLEDRRMKHRTNPPTSWFIAHTDHKRILKVVFIEKPNEVYEIKTAYEPNDEEEKIYAKYTRI